MSDKSITDILNGLSKEYVDALRYLEEQQIKYTDNVSARMISEESPHGRKTIAELTQIELQTGLIKSVMRYPEKKWKD